MRPAPSTIPVLAGPVPTTWFAPRSIAALSGLTATRIGGAWLIETSTTSPPEIVVLGKHVTYGVKDAMRGERGSGQSADGAQTGPGVTYPETLSAPTVTITLAPGVETLPETLPRS